MYQISKYSRIFTDIDDDVIVYNTINKAIISIPRHCITEGLFLNENISKEEINYLKQNDFIEGWCDLDSIMNQYEKFETLIISLELFLQCNLSCPYCYQIGNTSKRVISKEDLDQLFFYIQNVYIKKKYKTLVFKILGGEPTINWAPAEYIIKKIYNFCENNNVYLKLMIDTNGTMIKNILSLKNYHSLTLTIPLTAKEYHNRNRKYRSGEGTYDDIIHNINTISRTLKNVAIVLRYNIDHENIAYFEDYVKDLKSRLDFTPVISPNYTLNIGEGNFKNKLSHQEFVTWRSSSFIDILVANGFTIVITPYTITDKCQYWSRYSLKMFSDGTIGACAMSFWEKERPKISALSNNIEDIIHLSNGAKSYELFMDKKCRKCTSLFLCGGTYNLPCIKNLGERKCENPDSLHINLKLFLSRYIKYSNEGKSALFVGFNDGNIYR